MSQITVLTGPERRRRWSDEDKAVILGEAFGPGGCVTEVARRHDVSSGLIYTWRRNARAAAVPDFIEGVVAGAGKGSVADGSAVIRIELATARVSITALAPPVLVKAVLQALR